MPLLFGGSEMAQKKTQKKKESYEYRGRKYEIIKRENRRVMLTDGIIHFWIKEDAKTE